MGHTDDINYGQKIHERDMKMPRAGRGKNKRSQENRQKRRNQRMAAKKKPTPRGIIAHPVKNPGNTPMWNAFKNSDTDKKVNGYMPVYEDIYEPYRDQVKTFMEIGVFKGYSLTGFAEYFPKAKIIGIDINKSHFDSSILDNKRIEFFFGDATNEKWMKETVFKKYPNIDIVLDDGSHLSDDMRNAFKLIWPRTNMVYSIEDLGTQWSNNSFPHKGRKYGDQFIRGNSYINDIHTQITNINKNNKSEIFKISILKWFVAYHKM